ncbi:MAG TPA: regulatory protein RecX [Flavobacterium sp.]|nr:regulatory protein RecX [Flavobacterium sp.]
MKAKKFNSLQEAVQKLEYYCSYQERCHAEINEKLKEFDFGSQEKDQIIVHLIQNNFLNEERFACSFARGKHRIKHWGKLRIARELKFRNISQYNIDRALKEIDDEEYLCAFHSLAEKIWESISEKNSEKKKKKFCDYLIRKGFEPSIVYEKCHSLF